VRDTALRLQQERDVLTRTTLDKFTVKKGDNTIAHDSSMQKAKDSWNMQLGPRTPYGGQNTDLKWLL
jgi:hypothetical protein